MNPNDAVQAPRANSLDVAGEPKASGPPRLPTDERGDHPGPEHHVVEDGQNASPDGRRSHAADYVLDLTEASLSEYMMTLRLSVEPVS